MKIIPPITFYKNKIENLDKPRITNNFLYNKDLIYIDYSDNNKIFCLLFYTTDSIDCNEIIYPYVIKQDAIDFLLFTVSPSPLNPPSILPKLSLIKYLYRKVMGRDEFVIDSYIDLDKVFEIFKPKFDIQLKVLLYHREYRLKKRVYTLKDFI